MNYRGAMKQFYLLPIGVVEKTLLVHLQQRLTDYFQAATRLLDPLRLPTHTRNKKRNQHQADLLLREISMLDFPTSEKVIGITAVDIYTADLNFIFGQAESPGKNVLVSVYRLNPEFYGQKPNTDLSQQRVQKEVFHELGHAYHLSHCPDKNCVMYFSQTVTDIDLKQANFCPKCQKLFIIYNS